jgi:hypothetical protein
MSVSDSTNPHRYEYDAAADVVYCRLDFAGFPGYRVGDDGSVWTCWQRAGLHFVIGGQWQRLRGSPQRGYHRVHLHNNGKVITKRIHRLVCLAFIGPIPDGLECCHDPDRSPSNNRVCNLRYGTHKDNCNDRDRHGTTARGVRQGSAKFSDDIVRSIRADFANGGTTYVALSGRYGVTNAMIRRIVKRKSWKHVV